MSYKSFASTSENTYCSVRERLCCWIYRTRETPRAPNSSQKTAKNKCIEHYRRGRWRVGCKTRIIEIFDARVSTKKEHKTTRKKYARTARIHDSSPHRTTAINPDWKVSGKGVRLFEISHHFQLARQCSTAYKTSSAAFLVVANTLQRERCQQVFFPTTPWASRRRQQRWNLRLLTWIDLVMFFRRTYALKVINRTCAHNSFQNLKRQISRLPKSVFVIRW